MTWILVAGAVVCCWAMLRTMGGERERRVVELRAANAPPPPPPPVKVAPRRQPITAKKPTRQAA